MKFQGMMAGLLLVAVVAAGCGGKSADTKTPAADPPAQQETKTPAPSASGTKYTVDATGSSTSYAVREKFLGKELNVTAVGKTSAIEGEIILDKGVIQPSVVKADLSTLKSDEEKRDNQVRKALDTTNHKYATFAITGAEGNPTLIGGQEVAVKLKGNMTIKGTEKPLVFEGKAKLSGDTLTITADTTFKMTTFGVNPPNIANFVSVTDEVKLTVVYVGKK